MNGYTDQEKARDTSDTQPPNRRMFSLVIFMTIGFLLVLLSETSHWIVKLILEN